MAKETTIDIEARIGLIPGECTPDQVSIKMRAGDRAYSDVQSWLMMNGIPEREARKANFESLAKGYALPPYLKAWRRRVNPNFGAAMDALDSDFGMNVTPPPAAKVPSGPVSIDENTVNQVAAALAPVLATHVKANIDVELPKAVKFQLENQKLELSDNAKEKIRALAREAGQALFDELMPPRRIQIEHVESGRVEDLGLVHSHFERLLRACSIKNHKGNHPNIWLTGPTGSGKTSAGEQVAKALPRTYNAERDAKGNLVPHTDGECLPFYADSSLDADYKVMGFRNAQGDYVETEFVKAYSKGGIYLCDEADNWHQSAWLSLNSALANDFFSTPGGQFKRHPDFICIACANTWGHGATSDYVGRNKLDAATRDRFHPKMEWPYDEKLERAIAQNSGGQLGASWADLVIWARTKIKERGIKVIISPRTTYEGLGLLGAGFSVAEVVEMTMTSGWAPDQVSAVGINSSAQKFRTVEVALAAHQDSGVIAAE